MIVIQSPGIGNGLRRALALDAAGGMPLTMEQSVVPVALVADTVDRDVGVRRYSGWGNSLAVAAQFPTVTLGLTSAPPKDFLYAVPRSVTFYTGTNTFMYWRLGINSPPVTINAVPRELKTDAGASGSLAVVQGATAVGVVAAQQNGLIWLPTAQATRFDFAPMQISAPFPFSTLAGITFQGDVANVNVIAEFIWDEYYRT